MSYYQFITCEKYSVLMCGWDMSHSLSPFLFPHHTCDRYAKFDTNRPERSQDYQSLREPDKK